MSETARDTDSRPVEMKVVTPWSEELESLRECVTAFERVEPDSRQRMLGYLVDRYGDTR